MISIFGILFTFVMVFGGYLLAGGKLDIILKSLPFEMMMICGAAIGAFVLSNPMPAIKATIKDLKKVFSGSLWQPNDYVNLLLLLNDLLSIAKRNPMDLDAHLDAPSESRVFAICPKVLTDHTAVDMICDTLRSASMNYDDPLQVEDLLDKKIEDKKHHQDISVHALQAVADGLPALGIVAAVLGVIKTMGSIDQPPEVLGKLIGGALVGTFLGVFLAYCLVAPFSAKVKAIANEDINFYHVIKEVMVSYFQNHPVKTCLEVARQSIPHDLRPNHDLVEEAIRTAKLNV
jgi:chemotaxis protein MotA